LARLFADDEVGEVEVGGEVGGARVIADEAARFIEEGSQFGEVCRGVDGEGGELRGKAGQLLRREEEEGVELRFLEAVEEADEARQRPIFGRVSARGVEDDASGEAPFFEARGRGEAIGGGGGDVEEGREPFDCVGDHGAGFVEGEIVRGEEGAVFCFPVVGVEGVDGGGGAEAEDGFGFLGVVVLEEDRFKGGERGGEERGGR
jgi:hypothetical protein